ncbi:hypothetical protein ABIA31_001338 [Catenulispora sp. MAP5-51]
MTMTQPDIFDDDAPWAERLPELRLLLEAYSSVSGEQRFADTPDSPSKAMRSYLRMATYYPGRAFRATAEILDTLKRGLNDPEVAAELASMSPMIVPDGRTRENCLMMMVPHLVAFTEAGERTAPGTPETDWEWRERLPNLANLFGAYFHQDVTFEHPSPGGGLDYEAVIADFFATKRNDQAAAVISEIGDLLSLGSDEQSLDAAASELGSCVLPPDGLSHADWLSTISHDLQRRLHAVGYQPPQGPNSAYPAHDKRAWVR